MASAVSSRSPSMADFFEVEEEFDIVYQTVPKIEQACYYLIGEQHTRSLARHQQAQFIDKYVIPNSFLLVEGYAALVEIKGVDRERILNDLQISAYARPMLTVIG